MPRACSILFPKHLPILSERKRTDFISYGCSFVHHIVVVPMAIYRIATLQLNLSDDVISLFPFATTVYQAVNDQNKSILSCECAPFSFGYLAADTLMYAVPEALAGRYEYLVHHVLGMGLFYVVPLLSSDVAMYCSRVLIMESTSIFFTLAYVLRNTGRANSIFVPIFEIAFAVAFFLVRVLNMVHMMYSVIVILILQNGTHTQEIDTVKKTTGQLIILLFVPILILQLYWFGIIASKFVERYVPKKKEI